MPLMVTGHRTLTPPGWKGNPWPNEGNDPVRQQHVLISNIVVTYCVGYVHDNTPAEFISGMALGADQMFAMCAIAVRDAGYPSKITAAVPFKGQENAWPVASKIKFGQILEQSDETVYVSDPGYTAWKMQVRNQWMVDRADTVLAIWSGKMSGGTYNCIEYARGQGKRIDCINPQTLTLEKEI